MMDGKLFSWSGKIGTAVNPEPFLAHSLRVCSHRTEKVMDFYREHTKLVKDDNNNLSLIIQYRQFLLPRNIYVRLVYNRHATSLKPIVEENLKSWREELKEERNSAYMADTWSRAEFDAINELHQFYNQLESLVATM